ncbi:hypothetical protein JVT61DRAFT_11284 [Boletus reticuloceps]|uniref:Uncharacterized protein n=1 Tax=Boletus reticuloceps TaxID=495285 RepID=A0A8I2YEZ0_9AGAM|nr:hypothetical protein JVT61DRAFT_11284 [Boletus reticuloceps]
MDKDSPDPVVMCLYHIFTACVQIISAVVSMCRVDWTLHSRTSSVYLREMTTFSVDNVDDLV